MPDVAISPATSLPVAGQQLKKPLHLIELSVPGNKSSQWFLTTDKPEFQGNGFVLAKGFYFGMPKEFGFNEAVNLAAEIDKEEIEERYFPQERIVSIKNLFFKAK